MTRPESRTPAAAPILVGHVLATLLISTGGFTLFAMLPIIARIRFGADDWQTWMVTAAVPTLLLTSLFWGALLRRISTRTYLLVYWFAAVLPVAMIALVNGFNGMLACHLVASAGFAGWAPISGVLLKRFYSDAVHGRAYAALTAAQLLGGMLTVLVIGEWQSRDADAFRVYLPLSAVAQAVGLAALAWLASLPRFRERRETASPPSLAGVLAPVLHMSTILRRDIRFLRYEAAFMTYGVGFMICEVLLPVLTTDKLHLSYDQFAERALFVQRLGMLVLILPAGWVLDRLGAVRTSALSFAWLGLYPLGLILAESATGLAGASAMMGTAMSGVIVCWMLGPVALAPNPGMVPQYVAIHATLVGIRGVLFQFLGMLLYRTTGSFTWPLLVASLAFAAAAVQMWLLHGSIREAGRAAAAREAAERSTLSPPASRCGSAEARACR